VETFSFNENIGKFQGNCGNTRQSDCAHMLLSNMRPAKHIGRMGCDGDNHKWDRYKLLPTPEVKQHKKKLVVFYVAITLI
jgi:hypothetical protein